MVLSLPLGLASGWAANSIGVPLGWMLGAMLVNGLLSLFGMEFKVPSLLRWSLLAVLGLYLGASFTPDLIEWLPRAGVSIIGMFLVVAVEVAIATFVMIKVLRCSFFTAYAACMPGGFSSMTLVAQEHGADVEVVSLVHLVRVIVVLGSVSLAVRYFGIDTHDSVSHADYLIEPDSLMLGLAVVLVGLGIGIFLRLPIFCMLCAMLIAGTLHVTELAELSLPEGPLAIALALLGMALGSHWRSFRSGRIMLCLACGLVLALFLLAFSAGAALLVARTLSYDIEPMMLAYAPGGVSEISLIAVALDIDPAFVGLHHVVRVMFIFMTLPVILHLVTAHGSTDRERKGSSG